MHIIKLKILGESVQKHQEDISYYLTSLYRNQQIINSEFQYELIEGGMLINLYCPEKDAYKDTNTEKHGIDTKTRLEKKHGLSFVFEYHGIDPEFEDLKLAQNPNYYVLYGASSPQAFTLFDGEEWEPQPLYKIPYTYHIKNANQEIISSSFYNQSIWADVYEHMYDLWFLGLNEKWFQSQLQNHDSELNKDGQECAKEIEKETGIPTYYFLFNYRAWGEKKDRARKCPTCGGEWLLEDANYNHYIAFKCDPCRLVSQLSSNL